ILGSHPRLGEKKLDSAQSAAEQAQLRTAAEQLAALNAEYEAQFPGLRYVVFVDGREKSVIMTDMRRRIARGDIRLEEREGIQVSYPETRFSFMFVSALFYFFSFLIFLFPLP